MEISMTMPLFRSKFMDMVKEEFAKVCEFVGVIPPKTYHAAVAYKYNHGRIFSEFEDDASVSFMLPNDDSLINATEIAMHMTMHHPEMHGMADITNLIENPHDFKGDMKIGLFVDFPTMKTKASPSHPFYDVKVSYNPFAGIGFLETNDPSLIEHDCQFIVPKGESFEYMDFPKDNNEFSKENNLYKSRILYARSNIFFPRYSDAAKPYWELRKFLSDRVRKIAETLGGDDIIVMPIPDRLPPYSQTPANHAAIFDFRHNIIIQDKLYEDGDRTMLYELDPDRPTKKKIRIGDILRRDDISSSAKYLLSVMIAK